MGLTLEEGLLCLAEAPGTFTNSSLISRLDTVSALLNRYIAELERFNPIYGLVKVKSREELVMRHILDSLAPLGIISGLGAEDPAAHIADVGSGAGLPGIPLAIALPEFRFTLIERMGRRAGFLRNTIAVLALKNVTVEEVEMEKAAPGRFKLLCFRAFRPLEPSLLRSLFRLLIPGGLIAAYKGRLETILVELAALAPEGAATPVREILPCPVPGLNEERHVVLLRKEPFPCRENINRT
ncbi:MAG: 16S rRNA (guanine(527)-N(7))-methyltransferase RsmG [Treponema sp.]|jgi:16S rRNA (guanine527-N7)-methyltransferase|nr:16S rRNA (guanine(527)-N(7))-methyltransferase RsmG [Treponema sp.]